MALSETGGWHNVLGLVWEVLESVPRELVHTRVGEQSHGLPQSLSKVLLKVAQKMEETISSLNS